MHKVAVIGDAQSVLAFKALGLAVYTPENPNRTRNQLDACAKEGVGVIFITEELAEQVPETIERYDEQLTPAIILIPSAGGSLGHGQAKIDKNVERAIGSNIL